MNIPLWVIIPFEVAAASIDITLQESLVELQSDKARFKEKKHTEKQ